MYGFRWWELALGLTLALPWVAIALGASYNRIPFGLGLMCMIGWQVFFLSGIGILDHLGWLPS